MKITSLLATSSMLFGSMAAAENSPLPIFQELASNATANTSVEARLAAFPALADLPKDSMSIFALGDIKKMAEAVTQHPMIAPFFNTTGMTLDEVPEITSVAVAVSGDATKLMKAFNNASWGTNLQLASMFWSMNSAHGEIIQKTFAEATNTLNAKVTPAALPSIHLSVTFSEGNKSIEEFYTMLQMSLGQVLSAATEEDKAIMGLETIETADGFAVGVKLAYFESMMGEEMAGQAMEIKKLISSDYVYVMVSKTNDRLRFIIAGSKEALKFPASPAESAATCPSLDFANAEMTKNPFFLANFNIDAEQNKDYKEQMNIAIAAVNSVFTQLGAQDAEKKDAYDKASNSLTVMANGFVSLLMDNVDERMSFVAWADGNLNFEAYTGYKSRLTPGKLMGINAASTDSNILYMENAGLKPFNCTMTSNEVIDHAVNIGTGFALSMDEKIPAELHVALPVVKQLVSDIATSCSGFTMPAGFILDNAGSMPNFGNPEAPAIQIPQGSFFIGVKNRAAIADSWDRIWTTCKSFAETAGEDPAKLDALTLQPTQMGNMTCYAPAIPVFTETLKPHIMISDQYWMLGSNPQFSAKLAESFSNSTNFTGGVFVLKLAPIVPIMKSVADGMEENGQNTKASQLRQAAAFIQMVTPHIDGFYCVESVDQGKQVIRGRLQMKK